MQLDNVEEERKPGNLVHYRKRDWIVLPGNPEEPDVLILKPLGGSDQEITGVYLPLTKIEKGEKINSAHFPGPEKGKSGNFRLSRQLFDASRLLFRNAAGPFRCVGKLSFRPRAYQMVPLVMALKQDITRLLIADDVGIGKTIEALMIVRELMERGDIRSVAVLCPPHLCDQWQGEFRDKLDLEAVVIRSGTIASLERILPPDVSPFRHFPVQVISIDYLKSEKRKFQFFQKFPDLIIVDEAHTCARPQGTKSASQQQRHHLVSQIATEIEKHLVLLTATPHSGKEEEFRSLLALLNPDFGVLDLFNATPAQKKNLAEFFIQRKRDHIKSWLDEDTPFPERESREISYQISGTPYDAFIREATTIIRKLVSGTGEDRKGRARYWAALGLLRGLVSSPDAGIKMLQNRQKRLSESIEGEDSTENLPNPVIDQEELATDNLPFEWIPESDLTNHEIQSLADLEEKLQELKSSGSDPKIKKTIDIIRNWLKLNQQPIIFCRFIETANYVGYILRQNLPKSTEVSVITSDLTDDQRREQVALLGKKESRVLVATDCLSEGINLQEYFTAVLHYDLPWNPNRLEQREGRVDRFGQMASPVYCYLLYGADNPIDKIVLDILIKKVRDIQRDIGVTITLGEEGGTIMDAVLKEIFRRDGGLQADLFGEEASQISTQLDLAREKARRLRDIFAHQSIPQDEIKKDLKSVDEIIGNADTVQRFVIAALQHQNVQVNQERRGWELRMVNCRDTMIPVLTGKRDVARISFESPTPKNYTYIGRNHPLVEHLAQQWVSGAFDPPEESKRTPRLSVIRTKSVTVKTVLLLFRVRNVIREVRGSHEVIAEEMVIWGYAGSGETWKELPMEDARLLLMEAESASDVSEEFINQTLEVELARFNQLKGRFLTVAEHRADELVNAHRRFKSLVGGRRYEKVVPVLPPDILGFYVLVPVV